MLRDDVLETLGRLDEAGVRYWLHGGWGMDALLGEETRPHDDLDLAVDRDDLARLEAALPEYTRVPERDEWPSSFVLADARGRQIDLHPLRMDPGGDGWQAQADGSEVRWSREDLAGRGRVGTRAVRCTSPGFEAASHGYEGHDDIDRRDHELLARHFGLPLPTGPWPGHLHPKRVRARRAP
ncbi:MAG: amino acid transporter [Planctomycetes bacterium]|nr:amino acid transporter [Planctomycetota bacterium]MCB9824629.1 amino acid transporter [Planctomycetota bacterium]MCB9830126.1 amino acid transporter [Planctomycetota bacterium]MCB9899959.1 amino acid transporter [Planctomycetota bacterium]